MSTLDYDDILEHLGEFGKWNWFNQALYWIPPFIAGVMVLVFSFTGMQVSCSFVSNIDLTDIGTGLEPDKFRCIIPECDSGVSDPMFGDVPIGIYPLDDDDEKDYCKYYPPRENATQDTCNMYSSFDLTSRAIECDTKQGNFIYDDFEMDFTVVTEFDLVCDDQFMVVGFFLSFNLHMRGICFTGGIAF